ncbi:MAG: transglutaminase family protein, partial [Myxococcota bacterium]
MVFLLGRDRVTGHAPRVPAGARLSASTDSSEEYMGAYIAGERVGWMSTITTHNGDGWITRQSGEIRFRLQGNEKKIETASTAETDKNYLLRAFEIRITADGIEMSASGTVSGSKVKATIVMGGETREIEIPVKKDPQVDLSMDRYLSAKGAKAGDSFDLEVFDPQSLSMLPVKVDVIGIEKIKVMDVDVEATHLRRKVGGAFFDAWIDQSGRTLMEQGPLGITLVMENQAEGRRRGIKTGKDLIDAASIKSAKEIPYPESLAMMKMLISGVDLKPFDLAGGRQQFSNGVLIVTREDRSALKVVPIPVGDPSMAKFLAGSTFIESESPEIRKAALQAIGGSVSLPEAAFRLNQWLFRTLRKKNVAGIPDALSTLKSGEGDCNEHSYLFVAMARSVGIPARVNVG